MLPRRLRISQGARIKEILRQGRRISAESFDLVFRPAEDFRFAFVVSVKVSKKAVERNRLKRILAQAVRSELDLLEDPIEAVFIVKREFLSHESKSLKAQVASALKKVR